jgi:hypothetical protein
MREANHVSRIAGALAPQERVEERMRSDQHEARSGSGRTRRLALALMLVGIPLAGACDGDNVFTGDSIELQPRVVEVVLPQAVYAGDTVRIRVDGSAARQVAQAIVSLRGAVQSDTVVEVDPPQQQASAVVAVPIPELLRDTVLSVSARIADGAGVVSQAKEAFALAYGPPVVTAVSGPTGVRVGDVIDIQVSAFGARRIARLDLSARGAISTDTSVALAVPESSVSETIQLFIPAAVQDTLINLSVIASDQAGFQSAPRSTLVPFAIDTPSIQVLVPPSVEAGKVLNIMARAEAIRQISQLRVEFRGGVIKDSIIDISPTRTRTLEYIAAILPEDLIVPEVRVRVFALDRSNAISATSVYTVQTPANTPTIQSLSVYQNPVEAGHYIDVRVQATGARPIKMLRFRWRGFSADTISPMRENDDVVTGPETFFNPDPPSTSIVEDVAIETPCVASTAQFMMLVTAYDQDDVVSPIATEYVTVNGNEGCAPPPVVVDTTDTATVTVAEGGLPRFLALAPVPTWELPGPGAAPEGVALPARGQLRVRGERKRRA